MLRRLSALLMLWPAYGLRLYRLDFQSVWWDEGHSIFVAGHPLSQIPTLPAMDVHPPAYFALLRLWMKVVGQSEFALRYLSVVFSLLTVALLWRFAVTIRVPAQTVGTRRTSGTVTGVTVAGLASISPLYVAYAQEVRSYAMITFLALVSTFALWQVITRTNRRPWLVGYIIFTAACLYTHYFTIFLLLFHNLVWLGWVVSGWFQTGPDRPRKRTAPRLIDRLVLWIIAQIAVFGLFLPQFWLALRQVTTYTNPNLVPPTLTEFISRSWQAYTVGLTLDPQVAQPAMIGLAVILLLGAVLNFVSRRLSVVRHQYVFLSGWFLVPLIAYYLVLQRQPSFEPRYLILITPALFLLIALLLTSRHTLRPTAYTLLGLTIAILTVALHSYFTNPTTFKDDSAGVARWLAAETTANDIVFVDVPHPFHYYAGRSGIAAPTRYLFVDVHTAAETLNREAAGRDRLFWVTWSGSDTDPRGVIPFLAEKTGRRVDQRAFRGYRVTWYDLSGQTFSLPADLTPVQATFGDVLLVDGVAFSETVSTGSPAWATIHFSLLRQTTVDYRVSLRLRTDSGDLVTQVDRDLLNDRHFYTAAWPLPDPALNQAINVYLLPLPPETPPGEYQLEMVVYNAEPPYPSEGVSGLPSADGVSAQIGTVTVTRGNS